MIQRQNGKTIFRVTSEFFPFFAQQYALHFGIGEVVLCSPLASKEYFTPLAACYMASYLLGMLARYFPAIWINLGCSEKGDAVHPLVISLMDWIQEMYPSMILDVLRGPYPFETSQARQENSETPKPD